MITLDLVYTAAEHFNGDFNAVYESDEELGEAIVNYVDQSGDLYCERFAAVKALFPNFNY
jgi:hypothetical protein